MKKEISIFTDGACSGNPGKGGWGAVLLFQDNEKHLSGSVLALRQTRHFDWKKYENKLWTIF